MKKAMMVVLGMALLAVFSMAGCNKAPKSEDKTVDKAGAAASDETDDKQPVKAPAKPYEKPVDMTAVKPIETGICDKATSVDTYMTDVALNFKIKAMFVKNYYETVKDSYDQQGIKSLDGAMKFELDRLKENRGMFRDSEEPIKKCEVESKKVECEETYPQIANYLKTQEAFAGDEKNVAEIGNSLGIKNCYTMLVKRKFFDNDKQIQLFIGDVAGKTQVFYYGFVEK
jgi:hypothetical protein